jgi:transketolase
LERYGASAPYEQIYQNLGLTVDRVAEVARDSLERQGEKAGAQ